MAFTPEYAAKLAGQPALPQMTASAHTHALYDGTGNTMSTLGLVTTDHTTAVNQAGHWNNLIGGSAAQAQQIIKRVHLEQAQQQKEIEQVADPKRRLVKVVIIDPDDRIPLEKCILYNGSEKLTDLTDQELFFEIDIRDILHGHNEIRKKLTDKTVKERTEFLEPVKVRDLRMVVVTVASF